MAGTAITELELEAQAAAIARQWRSFDPATQCEKEAEKVSTRERTAEAHVTSVGDDEWGDYERFNI